MKIFIARNNEKHGPYNLDDIQEYLASGHLHGEDLAWVEGAPNWVPLSQIPGVQMSAGRVPPPPVQVATPPLVTKPKSRKPLIGCGCLTALLILIFAPVCNRMGVISEQAKQKSVVAGKQLDASSESMRQSFDRMETIARNNPALRQRIRDLRIEFEEIKDDPKKYEIFQRKLGLLQKDIQEDQF